MTRVLVTGMSGTGKTTLLEELGRRGHRVVDTDAGDWHEVVDGERLWREGRISALLDSVGDDSPESLFVQGTVRNQGRFRDRFDRVVLLSAPREVLVERLAARTRLGPTAGDAVVRHGSGDNHFAPQAAVPRRVGPGAVPGVSSLSAGSGSGSGPSGTRR